nr:RHS repeat-associated core domain-containing protein [Azoarcus sp. L1K30]
MVEIDGPLPNGPLNAPEDSDITQLRWDTEANFPIAAVFPGGISSTLQHDRFTGHLTGIRNDAGRSTQFVFNPRQQLTRIQRNAPGWPARTTKSAVYDALGNPTELSAGDGLSGATVPYLRQAFDVQGHLIWQARALGIAHQFRYDTEGRLAETVRSDARMQRLTRYRYDDIGHLTDVSDNSGRQQRLPPPSALPSRRMRDMAQTPRRLTRQDDFGRVVLTVDADRGAERRQFDAADRLISMRDARINLAQYAYDVRGRIRQQDIVDAGTAQSTATHWHYDGAHLVEIESPTQRERYTYDTHGWPQSRAVTLQTAKSALTAVTRYEHDASGQLTATSLPDGSRIEYRRNGQGQVVAVERTLVQTPWLRWLSPTQVIVEDLSRDLIGLERYVTGNGIEARYQRSRQGDLARILYRRTDRRYSRWTMFGAPLPGPGDSAQALVERILGIGSARAGTSAQIETAVPEPALPGALGLPRDPGAIVDNRYLWDARGNLLYQRHETDFGTHRSQAFDARDRLIVSVRTPTQANEHEQFWRYAYDAQDRRVLHQAATSPQTDLVTGTHSDDFTPLTHRLATAGYSASGQAQETTAFRFAWDAFGRLSQATHTSGRHTSYQYDHRGLRNRKTVDGQTTYFIHDAQRQPLAELDHAGRITRQYLYLADLPIAVIDTPDGIPPAPAERSALARIGHDVARIVEAWLGHRDTLVWLHANHLGAPEAATDASGKVIWRADYAPFGAATVATRDGFALHLRLPGQYFDAETGLHYNRQRYYDPEQGQYLSPDPLGTPDGPNPYAYARHNPLTFIDPDGLILFAFDGTENSDPVLNPGIDTLSNVVRFRDLYASGSYRYITGVGTVDRSDPEHPIEAPNRKIGPVPRPDKGFNWSGPARIERMVKYFEDEAEKFDDDQALMDVDIIGFSRGAAQARDFANIIAGSTNNGWFNYTLKGSNIQRCQRVNLRFLGLWDTVLSTNYSGYDYRLGIPAEFKYVAQAVALNEFRDNTLPGLRPDPTNLDTWGAFPFESIMGGPIPAEQTRIERGFLGSHSDIGGGFTENELSKVALSWMIAQAQKAGITMKPGPDSIIRNPVLHDKSNNIQLGQPTRAFWSEDRDVRYLDGTKGKQQTSHFDGMSYADTLDFIEYFDRSALERSDAPGREGDIMTNRTGTVNMAAYLDWLNEHDYDINLIVD